MATNSRAKSTKKTTKKTAPAGKKSIKSKSRGKAARDIIAVPRGMHDILPAEQPLWDNIRSVGMKISVFYGFSRIETPVLEKLDLFVRGVGGATDIVEKEMFTLRTKGGDKLALRPESTAAVMRSFLQHGMHKLPQPQKFFYMGPMFRHERPQAGRYRQFHQFSLEVLGGESDPVYDAQVITMTYRILEELKLKDLMLQVNSVGCRICRPGYRTKLVDYYKTQTTCKDCARRLKDNPLRLLDCKKEGCQPAKAGAPSIMDSLCSLCRTHLKHTLEYLEELELPYMLNPHLVRGLDYYNRTVFEIFSGENESALAGGGRYDYLAEMLGGRSTSAVGMSMGMERVVEILGKMDSKSDKAQMKYKLFLVHIGELAKKKTLPLMEEFRKNNIAITTSLGKSSLSNQLESADKLGVPYALILGQKEVYEECIIIRDMDTGVQESVPIKKAVEVTKKRLVTKK